MSPLNRTLLGDPYPAAGNTDESGRPSPDMTAAQRRQLRVLAGAQAQWFQELPGTRRAA
jgi:hypothetical protein